MTKPMATWVLWQKVEDSWEQIFSLSPISKDAWDGKTYINWLIDTMSDCKDSKVLPVGRKPKGAE